jgi:hypothetical protein
MSGIYIRVHFARFDSIIERTTDETVPDLRNVFYPSNPEGGGRKSACGWLDHRSVLF